MNWSFAVQRLNLKRSFTISRRSSRFRETVRLSLDHQGLTGWGEAAPNPRHGEDVPQVTEVFERLQGHSFIHDLSDIDSLLAEANLLASQVPSARSAIDMAIHDWLGKKTGKPLHEIWGIKVEKPLRLSMTISIDSPDKTRERVREASDFKVLKVKLGSPLDRQNIKTIREVTDTPLWVDANEGWTSREAALDMIEWLSTRGVELVEQPLPAGDHEGLRWLRERSPLPLIADESFSTLSDLPGIEEEFHGVNIKLAKSGGLAPARRIIDEARKMGLKLMLGTMVQSSCGIGAACQLAPLVDFVDLDCNLLLTNDPFEGHPVVDGYLHINKLPGTGVRFKGDIGSEI